MSGVFSIVTSVTMQMATSPLSRTITKRVCYSFDKLNVYTIHVLGPTTNYWIMKGIFNDASKICFPQIFLSIERMIIYLEYLLRQIFTKSREIGWMISGSPLQPYGYETNTLLTTKMFTDLVYHNKL